MSLDNKEKFVVAILLLTLFVLVGIRYIQTKNSKVEIDIIREGVSIVQE